MSVYFIRNTENGQIKIGCTKDMETRFRILQCASPARLDVLAIMDGGKKVEHALHRQFTHLRLRKRGEWFEPGPDLLEYLTHMTPPDVLPPSRKTRVRRHHLEAAWLSDEYESDEEMAWIFGMDADMLREAYGPSGRPEVSP